MGMIPSIGGLLAPSAAEKQLVSLDFDTTERLAIDDANKVSFHIGNAWSIAIVWHHDVVDSTGRIFALSAVGADLVIINPTAVTSEINFRNWGSGGSAIKDYLWGTHAVDTWYHSVWTWDGTNLKYYKNAVLTAADTETIDNAGTMANSTRAIGIGDNAIGGDGLNGNIMSVALFDRALTLSETAALHNSGNPGHVNLLKAVSPGPVHWWRLGHDAGDIGKDEGTATAVDVMDDAVGITTADIVSAIMGS